jgi:succinate dehydrogenase/fumarate reductase-like Fe-S protein
MKLNLKVWRQKNASAAGKMVDYPVDGLNPEMSFLEMVDVLNDHLIKKGEEPVAFDHDCREGICGMCSMSTAVRMARSMLRLLASFTFVASKMVRLCMSSHGGQRVFPL